MGWSDVVLDYCERGADPGFWAEPLNALTNLGFLVAAGLALGRWRRSSPARAGRGAGLALIALVAAIGLGSFAFHTIATRWARLADVIPIGMFMLAYLAFALRYFLALRWRGVVAGLAAFALALWGARLLPCPSGAPGSGGIGSPCFNGSLGYVPAVVALWLVGCRLAIARHPAGRPLLAAGSILTLSLVLRTLDRDLCQATIVAGQPIGTHFLWHLLNAWALFVLLVAATQGGPGERGGAAGHRHPPVS